MNTINPSKSAKMNRDNPPGRAAPSVSRPSLVRLLIQIPCFNEEQTLATTLKALPRQLPGIDRVEWLVINDGSTDRTVEVAHAAGADHILDLPVHMGLARAFTAGLERAIELGADIIVNTDADNQYDARDIPRLIAPILMREAEFVIGDRPINHIGHFSQIKRWLQTLGSMVVRLVSRADIRDAPSGFRALSREAALRMNVFDQYTYTLETIIQAGLSGIRTLSVPIRVNPETRPSRLIHSNSDYIRRSSLTILRVLFTYAPGKIFFLLGLAEVVVGVLLLSHWVWLSDGEARFSPTSSLIVAMPLLVLGVATWISGLLAELSVINRRLLEDIQYRLRKRAVSEKLPDKNEEPAG